MLFITLTGGGEQLSGGLMWWC